MFKMISLMCHEYVLPKCFTAIFFNIAMNKVNTRDANNEFQLLYVQANGPDKKACRKRMWNYAKADGIQVVFMWSWKQL